MRFMSYLKYGLRFFVLQAILTSFTIYYFDRFLINEYREGFVLILNNLLEDRDRFYPFVQNNFIKIDIYIALFIFIFLIILYSTKFFTYVNELTFSLDKKFFDEYFNLYLVWTSSLMTFLFIFRFSVVSRFYLFMLTFIVPFILQTFRNTELLSSLLGRSVANENYMTFNIAKDSIFRNLRIMTFRKNIKDLQIDLSSETQLIEEIDKLNKKQEVNLIILNIDSVSSLPQKIEEYLLNINKKVLIISESKPVFSNSFIYSQIFLNNTFLTYFNNDIQYGSKFILKRFMDIILGVFLIILLFPLFILIYIFIFLKDGSPVIIKQNRVGLHGKLFNMYKFRTMYSNSHSKRDDLQDLNKNDEIIFKIENDPRIFSGAQVLRKFSLDELPQLFNVLKGEMSLVGPRPLFKEDTAYFNENYMRRLNVLPGLTGLLQINERNTSEFEVWYKYDIEYINSWSLYLDVKILLKTPLSLFKNSSKGL
jgi:lipopolysaccharide/colanic/teichoic acid biosynthesis glycosyltransferase